MSFQEEIKKTVKVLKDGGIILYPTDTIWGIGCDATNAEAVKKVYDIKHREDSKSMLVLLDDSSILDRYVKNVPDIAWDLIDAAIKPLTIIYAGAKSIASNLIASDGTIGIRITSEEFSKQLVYNFRRPVVSTSANISGEPSPRSFADISEQILNAVDYIVDWRREETINPAPSSIIKLEEGGVFKIIRA